MTYTPPRTVGTAIGIGAIVVLIGADILFVVLIQQTPISVATTLWFALIVLSAPTLGFLAYRTLGLLRAQYTLNQNCLTIRWGGVREVVPMSEIARLVAGREVEANLTPKGMWWPGCLVGRGQSEEFGPLAFFATTPQDSQVYVVTEAGAYALSPADPQAFFLAFKEARDKGVTEQVEYTTVQSAFAGWDLWRDRWAYLLVGLPMIATLLLFGYIALEFPRLPNDIPLHFDSRGLPDRRGSPNGLFILPLIATLAWLVNTPFGAWLHIHREDRLTAYLLWSATLLVLAILWVATTYLLSRAGFVP